MAKKGVRLPTWCRVAVAAGVAVLAFLSLSRNSKNRPHAAIPYVDDVQPSEKAQELLVTGYCNCGTCCGWRKKWFIFGKPVYNYGKMKGTPKKVGVTASGTVAAKGTIAADPSVYPFGTKMEIPGYGVGTVQDIGGSIKGAHIDLWFPSHEEATAWGVRKLKVNVAKAKSDRAPLEKTGGSDESAASPNEASRFP